MKVANHWQQTLADGSYPAATSLSTAQAAAKPVGINWEYAWGVNLYGQLHVADATGNKTFESFVLNHNLICARYYAWLESLANTLTNTTGLANFQNTNAVLGTFFTLGKLDYCGSMTSQMLEGALRHTNGLTVQQLQMAMVTANYISTGQGRTNGTLWRPTVDGGTIWADDLYMSCPFLIRWYQYTGNTNFLNDAAQQVMNMAGYLQDTNGLWFHGYFADEPFGQWRQVGSRQRLGDGDDGGNSFRHADESSRALKFIEHLEAPHRRRGIGASVRRHVASGLGSSRSLGGNFLHGDVWLQHRAGGEPRLD